MTERQDDGTILTKFFNKAEIFEEKVTLSREGTSVRGTMEATENFDGESHETAISIAGDGEYFRRFDGGSSPCLSQKDFHETVHRYNLYDSTGTRVERNSGFSITFTNDAGEKFHGYIGYHGLWLPEEAGLKNGGTFHKETDEVQSEGTPYTAFIVGGKLKVNKRHMITMEDLHGMPLNFSQCNSSGVCTNNQGKWNKETQKLMITHKMNEEHWFPEPVATPTEVVFGDNDFGFYFWAPNLGGAGGGSGQANLKNETTGNKIPLTNKSVVTFFKEEIVLPGSSDIPKGTLACFRDCIDPSNTGSYISASRFEAGDNSYERKAESVAYSSLVEGTHYAGGLTFDADAMVLKSGTTPLITEEEGEFGSGLWTGEHISTSDLSKLACPWDSKKTCPYRIREVVDKFWSWETGPNDWNQLALAQDQTTGEFQTFEAPLFLEGEAIDEDGNPVPGFFEYNGPGELQGFNGHCVSMDTGEKTECGIEDESIRWVPATRLNEGDQLTEVSTGTIYTVKPIDIEQRMKGVDAALCDAHDLKEVNYELPDESLRLTGIRSLIGEEDETLDTPAVIGGALQ